MPFKTMVSFRNMGKAAPSVFLLFCFFLFPRESFSEFYKYVDKDGKIHFVDSKTKIPKEYRKDLKTYEEKYDHLSEEEREKKLEENRKKAEEFRSKRERLRRKQEKEWEEKRRRERIVEEEHLEKERRARLEQERLEKERAEREEFLKNFETEVEIIGYGQVIVPCTLVYKKKEIEVLLLLDTGASHTTLHKDAARELNLKGRIKGEASVAGGGKLKYKIAKLDYFKVGPYKVEDFYVDIIKHKGSNSKMKGLLGMDFLVGREYNIDYVRKVIRWVP